MNPTWIESFDRALDVYADAADVAKPHHRPQVLTAAERLLRDEEGTAALYERMPDAIRADLFHGSVWERPERLVPTLVEGTLRAGGETALMEALSELRMLALAEGLAEDPEMTPDRARSYLEDVLVLSLDLAFPSGSEADRAASGPAGQRARVLFGLILQHLPLGGVRRALAREVGLIMHQRPIVTLRARTLLVFARERFELSRDDPDDRSLLGYLDAIDGPGPLAREHADPQAYDRALASADEEALAAEAAVLGRSMLDTGLVAAHHAVLVRRLVDRPELLAEALQLNDAGRQQLQEHLELVAAIVDVAVHPATEQSVVGLAEVLNRGLLGRDLVRAALTRMMTLEVHDDVAADVMHSVDADLPAHAILLADTLNVLGQPLGVSQGWSPTCQSARGIALWSQFAPGKLLDMVISVARSHRMEMRFEGATLDSSLLPQGLQTEVDYTLDAVSTVLVPHLDRIYNEMMRRAAFRGDDPHKWVNPALYGHWIPTGFRSAFDPVTHAINDYASFVRTFYASHHPSFNGGHDLAYPSPVGLFITSARAELLGFHAVSLLRVAPHGPEGEMRAYFLNPNAEGRQDWGLGVEVTVHGHGERPGESSLPFAMFVARLYAFHYNPSTIAELEAVGADEVGDVTRAARESWGSSYTWLEVAPV